MKDLVGNELNIGDKCYYIHNTKNGWNLAIVEVVNEMKHLNDISYKDCVGKICKSKSSGDFKIINCNNAKNVEIKFLKTEHEMVVTLDNVRTGLIKDPYSPSELTSGSFGEYNSKLFKHFNIDDEGLDYA